ncbi:hypothetical protein COOONC_21210, partial [Cooperia oncophora]
LKYFQKAPDEEEEKSGQKKWDLPVDKVKAYPIEEGTSSARNKARSKGESPEPSSPQPNKLTPLEIEPENEK